MNNVQKDNIQELVWGEKATGEVSEFYGVTEKVTEQMAWFSGSCMRTSKVTPFYIHKQK